MTSRDEMVTCPITGNTHIWVFKRPTEGVHPADGKTYAWYAGACGCGMKLMMEKQLNTPEFDLRELPG